MNETAAKQPRTFGKKIKSFCKKKRRKGENLKMEDLVNYFKNILSNDTTCTQSDAEVPSNDNIFDPELDADITLEELKSAVFTKKVTRHTVSIIFVAKQ